MNDTIRDDRQIMVAKNLETNNNRHPNVNVNLTIPTTMNPPPRDVKPDRLITNLSLSLSATSISSNSTLQRQGRRHYSMDPKPETNLVFYAHPRAGAHTHTQVIVTPQNRSVRSQIEEAHSQTLNPELQIPESLF